MGSGYSAMSASYVVLRTPHSRWIMGASHSFDDFFTEDAVGPDHEGQDHQHVGREVLGAAAHVRIDVACGEILHDPDDEAADDGPGDGIEPAQDHHRKDLEADQG